VALVTGAVFLAAGAGSSPAGLVGYTFASFVLAAIVLEFARGTRARRSLGDDGWLGSFAGLVGRNRRRYGGYVVHAAIVILLIGAIGIGGFGTTREPRRALAPGATMRIGAYDLTYLGSVQRRSANALEMRARFDVARDGKPLGVLSAGKNRYFAEQQTSNEVAIRSDWLRGEDLFVIVGKFNNDGSIFLKVLINPLVNLIWLAGLVFVGVGAALCLTPITSLAMTAVPTERAGMASGIMSAQRALGSTVGFAVLGSILAAALTATLSAHLADALPDPIERKEVAATIIGNANPRAYSGEIGPGRPIQHLDAATQNAILAAADSDFVEGIRFSLATAMVFLALVLAAGFAWFPRGKGAIADAEREAQALASEETAREGPL